MGATGEGQLVTIQGSQFLIFFIGSLRKGDEQIRLGSWKILRVGLLKLILKSLGWLKIILRIFSSHRACHRLMMSLIESRGVFWII